MFPEHLRVGKVRVLSQSAESTHHGASKVRWCGRVALRGGTKLRRWDKSGLGPQPRVGGKNAAGHWG